MDNTYLKKLPNKTIRQRNHYTYHLPDINTEYQIDLMFMPSYNSYKYVFVMCDINNTTVYTIPLLTKKAEEVLKAFQELETKLKYKNGCIFVSDSGTEYKGVFLTYLKQRGYFKKNIEIGNHRQLCFVDNAILYLTKEIYKTDKTDNDNWVERLQTCTNAVNESRKKNFTKNKKKKKDVKLFKYSSALIDTDTLVHIILPKPKGGFRAQDKRFSDTVYKVENIIIKELNIPMYKIKGISEKLFYKDELLIARNQEENDELEEDEFIVEMLLDKKTIKGKVCYLVKWDGFTNDDNTWEPRKELYKNPLLKRMIDKYELTRI